MQLFLLHKIYSDVDRAWGKTPRCLQLKYLYHHRGDVALYQIGRASLNQNCNFLMYKTQDVIEKFLFHNCMNHDVT